MKAWLGKLARIGTDPILIKELRGSLRGTRFFAMHLTVLGLFTAGLLVAFVSYSAGGRSPEGSFDTSDIGRSVYAITQTLHLLVAFLVVPAFGATAITVERERQTHDILMTTTLTARRIVWGKLLSSMTQAGILFVSLVPIVALTFLYGGVTVRQMLSFYVFLAVLCLTLSMWSLSVSASAPTSQRAVISSYALTILAFLLLWIAMALIVRGGLYIEFARTYGFITDESPAYGYFRAYSPPHWGALFLYVYLIPAAFVGSLITLAFINAVARLKSPFENKSAPFRIFYLVVGLLALGLAWVAFSIDVAGEPADDRIRFLRALVAGLAAVGGISSIFASESPVPPRHLRDRYDALPPHRRWMRLFAPGSGPGDAFCLAANGILAAIAIILFMPYTDGFNQGDWRNHASIVPFLSGVMAALAWIFFLSGVGAWLSAFLRRPTAVRVILILVLLGFTLLPLLYWGVSASRFSMLEEQSSTGSIVLALSPISSITNALSPHARSDFPMDVGVFGIPVPLIGAQLFIFVLAGFIFRRLAAKRRATLRSAA